MACQVTVKVPNKDVWVVYNGCSNHMIGHSDFFSHLDTSFSSSIGLGDDRQDKASGKGVVPVLTKQNVVKNIYDIYYVPNFKHNLLSVGQLDANGYDVSFHNTTCMISDRHKSLVAKIPMTKNRLYQLQLKSEKLYAHNVSTPTKSDLWHLRYGHLPIKSISFL